jgi:hypothetical protein
MFPHANRTTDVDREVVVIALSYLDRHLSRRVVDRRTFQLAATACLCLSAKVNGEDLSSFRSRKRRRLRIPEVAYLSGGYLDARDIINAELDVLHSLSWLVHSPTPLAFARDLLVLLDVDVARGRGDSIVCRTLEIEETVEYLIELSSCDYALSTRFRPSSVAIASIAHSVELTSTTTSCDGSSSSPSLWSSLHVAQFLRSVERAGFDVTDDGDVVACLVRLREVHAPAAAASSYRGDNGDGGDRGARAGVIASPVCPSRME